ncbi:MKK3 [Scenedesmus sp. PABB004]|nr:MKK3 [Scenedesmus sp. PABB004]
MPPRPFALKIVTEPERPPDLPAAAAKDAVDAWQVGPDGSCAMLGRSLKGQYVFSADGLVKAGGQAAPHYKVREGDIMLLQPLGAGACATVHKGFHHGLQRFVAVKRVSMANEEVRQQMLRDVKVLADADDVPGLIRFLGAYVVPARDQMAVVLEYMDGGTLADLLKKLGRLPEDVVACVAAKVLQGLAFMHARHMVHRDIKPANILLSLAGAAKLSDFGIAATVDHTLAQCTTYAGTVTYMSPERLENRPYSFKADIWSLGMVLVECLTGRYPFEAAAAGGPMDLILHVLQDDVPLPPHGAVSEACRDFLAACLARDPSARPPASALLAHPWLAGGGGNLRGLMRQAVLRLEDKLEEVGVMFASTYYAGLARGELYAPLYMDHSVLTYQGKAHTGRPAILARLGQATTAQPGGGPRPGWRVTSVDSQPLGAVETGCVLVLVQGVAELGGAAGAGAGGARFPFAEAFTLAHTPSGAYYVANQALRLL